MSNPKLTVVIGQPYERVLSKAEELAKSGKCFAFNMVQSDELADFVFDGCTSQRQVYRSALRINAISNSVLAGQSMVVPFGDYDDCFSTFMVELVKRVCEVDCIVEYVEV